MAERTEAPDVAGDGGEGPSETEGLSAAQAPAGAPTEILMQPRIVLRTMDRKARGRDPRWED
jgi:hypothetical protein